MYMNRITLIGFTGHDAKAAATQTGKEVTRFSLATTKRYLITTGHWRDLLETAQFTTAEDIAKATAHGMT
jgi:single-stranded DNA-binding protein